MNRLSDTRLLTVFVDEDDTHCAVGHLMATDGQQSLVARIRAERNTATVWELANDDEVLAWADEAGFTLEELARIQPSYAPVLASECICDSMVRPLGIVEGRIVDVLDEPEWVVAEVEVLRSHGAGPAVGTVIRTRTAPGDTIGRFVLVHVVGEHHEDSLYHYIQVFDASGAACIECSDPVARCLFSDQASAVPVDVYVEALMSEDCHALVEPHNNDYPLWSAWAPATTLALRGDSPAAGCSSAAEAAPKGWSLFLMVLAVCGVLLRRGSVQGRPE